MIQNGRVVGQEIECRNIKPGMVERAWEIVEVGLFANRYVSLFADSISTASLYDEHMEADPHGSGKTTHVDELRQE